MVMASRDGKGLIVVSGAAFMSNFEVQYQPSDCETFCPSTPSGRPPISKVSGHHRLQRSSTRSLTVYVQDETAGINAFKIGDRSITGTTSSYRGERQIAVTSIEKIADAEAPAPLDVTAAQVNDGSVLGTLVRVKAPSPEVEEAEGKIQTIMVKDAAGNRPVSSSTATSPRTRKSRTQSSAIRSRRSAWPPTTTIPSSCPGRHAGLSAYPYPRPRRCGLQQVRQQDLSVTLVTDGGTINSGNVTAYIEGVGAVLPTDVTRRNYIFLGWFTANNIRVTEISAADSGDKIFYAHWMAAGAIPGIIDAIGDSMRFDDVTKGDWFYKDVEYVYNEGIMDGVSKREFAPNETLTRAMIVKILYRIEGEPAGYRSPTSTTWKAADGTPGQSHGLRRRRSSRAMATASSARTILSRVSSWLRSCTATRSTRGWSTTTASGNLDGFKDAASVSSYAVDAMNWAVDEGLLKGANNKLSPKSNATRAQVAAIIHRYLKG